MKPDLTIGSNGRGHDHGDMVTITIEVHRGDRDAVLRHAHQGNGTMPELCTKIFSFGVEAMDSSDPQFDLIRRSTRSARISEWTRVRKLDIQHRRCAIGQQFLTILETGDMIELRTRSEDHYEEFIGMPIDHWQRQYKALFDEPGIICAVQTLLDRERRRGASSRVVGPGSACRAMAGMGSYS
jgi:hypothetical protein